MAKLSEEQYYKFVDFLESIGWELDWTNRGTVYMNGVTEETQYWIGPNGEHETIAFGSYGEPLFDVPNKLYKKFKKSELTRKQMIEEIKEMLDELDLKDLKFLYYQLF